MKKKIVALIVSIMLALSAIALVGAPANATEGTGWSYSVAQDCTPTPGSPAVEYQAAVYGDPPLISEAVEYQAAVYEVEYEFVHKNPNHPQSPRWETDPNWNAESNPQSKGWYATGNTRQGDLISPEVQAQDAVYGDPPLISAEVQAQDAVEANDCQVATARWILPNGGTADNVTWPQLIANAANLDAIPCGQTVTIQVDDYPYGTADEKARTDALDDDGKLDQGEDYGWAFNWRFETFTSEECVVVPPKPEPDTDVRYSSSLDCERRIVNEVTEGNVTGEPVYDAETNTWKQGEWQGWTVIDSKLRDATETECPVVTPPTEEPPTVEEPKTEKEQPAPASFAWLPDDLAETGATEQQEQFIVGMVRGGVIAILLGAAFLWMRHRKLQA